MKVTLVSDKGGLLGLAYHLSSEGHDVTLVTPSSLGQGLVPTSSTLEFPTDLVVFDKQGVGAEADNLRKRGNQVIGPSRWSDLVNDDKDYAKAISQAVGWSQSELNNGTNLYATAWFNGVTFISVYASLIYRRFMSGGTGPDLGATGMLADFFQPTNAVYHKLLKPMEPILKKISYKGCLHLHTLINEDRFCVKEISTEFSHPLSLLQYENGRASVAQTLLRALDITSQTIPPISRWAAGVLLTVPPFPSQASGIEIPVRGVHEQAVKHTWFSDIKLDDKSWTTAGMDGRIGWVTARGASPSEATKRVYRTISNLSVPNLQYRYDIGARNIYSLLSGLSKHEWIKPIQTKESA